MDVLCMAPTEYRAIAKRAGLRRLPGLRHAVAAGEPLNPEIVDRWREEAGVAVHDGYGQTETGALTGMPLGEPVRPGSMGRPLPGFRLWVDEGELVADPSTIPTFFLDGPAGTWRTGDRVREDEDGYLWFEGRTDDVIISAGYRIGPFEVESALVSHPAVAEAAAVAAPDEERGQVVRAVVVLRDGYEPGEQPGRGAPGPREGSRRRRTSTRGSWTSPTPCPRRPAARSGVRSCARGSLEAMANRLADETSPYLLQHRDNPVDWQPWDEQALAQAREQDRPILLSIGYSACHWCHVMERESFEDEDTAAFMNEHFVCIKLDREERPDLDSIYMEACQAMTGRGGWPLNVFLTPEQVPFYAGTYFPPEERHGMPSWSAVLEAVSSAWEERADEIRESGARVAERLRGAAALQPSGQPLDRAALDARAGVPARDVRQPHRRLRRRAEVPGRLHDRAAAAPRATPR